MKPILSTLAAGLLFAAPARAQNWQTVRPGDTAFFSAGQHSSYQGRYYHPRMEAPYSDLHLLRTACVSAAGISGKDTIYRFFSSLRDTSARYSGSGGCVDTLAPSWLGPVMIRSENGIERYLNSFGDTITFRTLAQPGEHWTLATDTAGLRFEGRVTAAGTTLVDGVADSFKTISIQAFSGSAPVAHPYNAPVFQLSKAHGWLKTLDLFRFPNGLPYRDQSGIAIDSTQHSRLPASRDRRRMLQNITWKYQPGNEWIWKYEAGFENNPDRKASITTWRHDSMLSFQQIATGTGIATIRSRTFNQYHTYLRNPGPGRYIDSVRSAVDVHADTVRDAAWPLGHPLPEAGWQRAMQHRWFQWPFDSTRYFLTQTTLPPGSIVQSNGCAYLSPLIGAPDDRSTFSTWLPDFGLTGYFSMVATADYVDESYGRYIYIRAGETVFGQKLDVAALNVARIPASPKLLIFPNPAAQHVQVTLQDGGTLPVLRLRSIAGAIISELQMTSPSQVISTADLPAGMYILECIAPGWHEAMKILVNH